MSRQPLVFRLPEAYVNDAQTSVSSCRTQVAPECSRVALHPGGRSAIVRSAGSISSTSLMEISLPRSGVKGSSERKPQLWSSE